MRVQKFEMVDLAAQMLIRHIESKQAVTPQKVYLDAALVIRESTAPPAHSRIASGSIDPEDRSATNPASPLFAGASRA